MTTGRINQVTAEDGAAPPWGGQHSMLLCVDDASDVLGHNASSHGFRTCPYHRSAPASGPMQRMARLDGVPPIAGFVAPARE